MEEQKIVIHADPDLADDIPWYVGQMEEYTEAIEKAMGDNDFETIEDAGHRMKGSGETFGFDAVSKMGKSIEMAAKEKDLDEIRKKVEALARYIKMVAALLDNSQKI